ncbi:MAG: hypothetical protein JSR46_06645, partial [Verrucomicrobia bacterium]|nr:hypothetical protein [Verrucomicrobiota bacterium]
KNQESQEKREGFFDLALEEFGKLRGTPGAPLEYLGKSFVYKELGEYEEEAKCFELALRRYRRNPILSIVEEQIVFRMHESSRQHRIGAYHFIGLVTRFLKEWAERPSTVKLFMSLQKNWEIPFFILHPKEEDAELKRLSLCFGVGFWLAKPHIIAESIEDLLGRPIVAIGHLADAIFLLAELGAISTGIQMVERIRSILSDNEKERYKETLHLLDILLRTYDDLEEGLFWLQSLPKRPLTKEEERLAWFLLRHAIDYQNYPIASQVVKILLTKHEKESDQEILDACIVEYLLYQNDSEQIEKVLKKYTVEELSQESSPLYFVYTCYLVLTVGVQYAFAHFAKLLDISFPRSWVLGAHFLAGKIQMTPAGWFNRSFMWERRVLYQQLALFWHSARDEEKSHYWRELIKQEYVN